LPFLVDDTHKHVIVYILYSSIGEVMLKFKDLVFKEDPDIPLTSARVDYELYTLSVVKERLNKGTYEIAILRDGVFVRLPGINTGSGDTVLRYLSEENVTGVMVKLASITLNPGILVDSPFGSAMAYHD